MSAPIALEYHGDIALLTLRHGKASALDSELCEALRTQLRELGRTDRPRAIVMTGTGRIFSAGVDLLRVLDGGPTYLAEFVPLLAAAVESVFTFPRPVVAAINGHAIAGGCIIACAADHRIMAEGNGRIGVPELLVGVPFPTGALEILRFAVPAEHLPALVYGGATYTPADALHRGLVDEVVPGDALLDTAVRAAESLASLAPDIFGITKRQLRANALARIEAARETIDREVARVWSTPEALERVKQYVETTLKKR